jgi:hypothetical protein
MAAARLKHPVVDVSRQTGPTEAHGPTAAKVAELLTKTAGLPVLPPSRRRRPTNRPFVGATFFGPLRGDAPKLFEQLTNFRSRKTLRRTFAVSGGGHATATIQGVDKEFVKTL